MELGGRSEREAGKIIIAWLDSGVLIKGSYYHTESRHEVTKVTLDEAKARAILAETEAFHAPFE